MKMVEKTQKEGEFYDFIMYKFDSLSNIDDLTTLFSNMIHNNFCLGKISFSFANDDAIMIPDMCFNSFEDFLEKKSSIPMEYVNKAGFDCLYNNERLFYDIDFDGKALIQVIPKKKDDMNLNQKTR